MQLKQKKELDKLKEYVREHKKAPKGYESKEEADEKGKLVDIIFDIVGDVKQRTDKVTGLDKYTINTNQTNAVINSVIQFKDAKDPIEIKKVDNLIVLKGKGTLALLNYGEIWWHSFETYISDEEDYVVDEIIEEEEDEDYESSDGDSYIGNHEEMEIDPNSSEEDRSNIEISLFDPLSLVTAGTSLFIDGFELELKNIILMDEGASLGGKLAVEIPIGTKNPTQTQQESNQTEGEELTQEQLDDELGELMRQMFMTDEEKEEERLNQEQEEANAARKAKRQKPLKIMAAIINDDQVGEEFISLFKEDIPTSTKVETVLKLIPQSKELITKIIRILKDEEDEDEDDGKVGVAIDVKKVIFGKKYGEDFIYDDIKYIGTEGEGEVSIELPGIAVPNDDKEKEQGINAKLAIDTLEGIYSLKADVNIKLVEAHALITIMRFKRTGESEYTYRPDDLVLYGGYVPGIPIAGPVFVNKVGGGVEDLYGFYSGDKDAPPMKIVVVLGLNIVPAFEGDFKLKASREGFTLDGALSIKNLPILKQARIEVHWVRPVYLALAARLEAFEIIKGEASIYVGEIKDEDHENSYKFFFEGRAKAEICIPERVKLVGGAKLANVELGVSTIKLWGRLKIGFIPLGITWIYDEGIKFGKEINGHSQYMYASLTDVELPRDYWNFYEMQEEGNHMTMVVGDNISILGSSKNKHQYIIASLDDNYLSERYVFASVDNKVHNFDFNGSEIGLIELEFDGAVPNLKVTAPDGSDYALVSMEDDPVNGNYRVQIIPDNESQSGKEEKYVYIAVQNPMAGLWKVESDVQVESTLMDVAVPPGFSSINMTEVDDGDKLNITWDAHHAEDALVSLFLIKEEEPESAGYAVASNLSGNSGDKGIQVDIPKTLGEGNYKVRATIQNPAYGYESIISDNSISIIDNDKPSRVTSLKAEPYGNGFIKAEWDAVEEEGDISYFATVYDANGNEVEDFTNYETVENNIILGGQFKDKTTGKVIKLDTDKEYTIGITAKKTLNYEDGTQTIHIGEEALSEKVFLRTPQPPNIYTEFKNKPIIIQSEGASGNVSQNYFDSNIVEMNFKTDQEDVKTTVYLDGEYFLEFDKKEFKLYFDLEDGKHKVEFKCENSYKNSSSRTVNFNIDTTPPQLLIDYPKPGFISDSKIVDIRGTAENGSIVKINGKQVLVDNNVFTYEYELDEAKLKNEIVIEAFDKVGNTAVYATEVTNGMVGEFKDIYISPPVKEILCGTETEFTVFGIDDKDNEIEIAPQNIQWSILEGQVLAAIDEKGILKANESGKVVLKASYYISEDYCYDAALELELVDNSSIEYIYRLPNISSVYAGNAVKFNLYEALKHYEKIVDNSLVTWKVIKGNEFGQIDKEGKFKALKNGTVKIQGSYTDKFDNYQELVFEIKVLKKDNGKDNDKDNDRTNKRKRNDSTSENKDIDKTIEKIWRKLLENEGDMVIEAIKKLKAGQDRKISIRGIVEIELPGEAVTSNDEMFIGTLNNPEKLVNSQDYTLRGDIIELQLKEAQGNLKKPIKVMFKYRHSNSIDTNKLGVYYFNPRFESWEPIDGEIDAKNGTILVELNHLSKYAVLEKKKEIPEVMPNKEWKILFNKKVDKTTINSENIMILDSQGNSKAVRLEYDDVKKSVKVIPVGYYEKGKIYYLCIKNNLLSKNKVKLNKEINYMFKVKEY
jgi:hypothetical protein